MKINDITQVLESVAPLSYQESYDNSGLICGLPNNEVERVLLTLDITESVVNEAINKKCNLIIAHHPIIFRPIKSLTGKNYVERSVMLAIRHDISIYACHTNLDAVPTGVNSIIAEKLHLQNCKILQPIASDLRKLVTFVPVNQADNVRAAICDAGAGHIGAYDNCTYNLEGFGTFRGLDGTNPYVGEKGKIHHEPELRIETIFPKHLKNKVLSALLQSHPYEEVAYDIYPLENENNGVGAGLIGELENEIEVYEFLGEIKKEFNCGAIKYTQPHKQSIKKVAICGGSGSFLLPKAIEKQADIFISGDFTYHQFFDAENKIIIADIGHFESEQYTLEIFFRIISKKIPKFAALFSEIKTNPVMYY